MTVAIGVIVALPGLIPQWMKVEQSGCGLLLLCVVIIVNGKHLRAQFATPGVQTSVEMRSRQREPGRAR
jgi:preprotein translocase subunit SecY